jgi:metal-responsive CopG/Arc/MetJ family transcriptional regulator
MASRKMTFTVPEELAEKLVRHVRARDRSRYVAEAIAARLQEREERMIRACDVVNSNADILSIERDFDAIDESDRIEEPWNSAPPR